MYSAILVTFITISFFLIRPYWIDYQVSIKTEQLNTYLDKKYPDQHWKITRKIGRQYNPYELDVEFDNEKGLIYSYFVKSVSNIKQNGFSVPDGLDSRKAKHFQREDW
jgi:hypothetical protein